MARCHITKTLLETAPAMKIVPRKKDEDDWKVAESLLKVKVGLLASVSATFTVH